jgi:hypothetical protein
VPTAWTITNIGTTELTLFFKEDTVELLLKFNNNNDNDNGNGSGNNNRPKKPKTSPIRRLAFPLSRALTLPNQNS